MCWGGSASAPSASRLSTSSSAARTLSNMKEAAGSKAPLPTDAWQTYRRLISYLRPHRGMFALGMLGAGVFTVSMLLFSLLAKHFGDGTFENRDPRTIVWMPLALVGIFLLRGIGDFTQT